MISVLSKEEREQYIKLGIIKAQGESNIADEADQKLKELLKPESSAEKGFIPTNKLETQLADYIIKFMGEHPYV